MSDEIKVWDKVYVIGRVLEVDEGLTYLPYRVDCGGSHPGWIKRGSVVKAPAKAIERPDRSNSEASRCAVEGQRETVRAINVMLDALLGQISNKGETKNEIKVGDKINMIGKIVRTDVADNTAYIEFEQCKNKDRAWFDVDDIKKMERSRDETITKNRR